MDRATETVYCCTLARVTCTMLGGASARATLQTSFAYSIRSNRIPCIVMFTGDGCAATSLVRAYAQYNRIVIVVWCVIRLIDFVCVVCCFLRPASSTSYPEATSLLTVLLQASHTNALLTSTQKMLRHRLPLGSFLLKPVQRILKYHLLLEVSAAAYLCNRISIYISMCNVLQGKSACV